MQGWTLEDTRNAIACDLEDLLNTRRAMPEALLHDFPYSRQSVLAYGVVDFSALCASSEADRKRICAEIALAISRHEPRLMDVRARLVQESTAINRIGFRIHARLKTDAAGPPVCFDGMLEPSGQRCFIRCHYT